MTTSNRPQEIAKVIFGLEVVHAATHAYLARPGTEVRVLGRKAPRGWHVMAAVANAMVALRLGIYVWRRPRHAGLRRKAQTDTHESFVWLLRDIRQARKQGAAAIAARQRARLAELVAYARERSPFYRELYQGLPERVEDPTHLPVTSKQALMANFDAAVTDREVTLQNVRAFIADLDLIGEPFLGKYLVATTSGTTGMPGIFVLDGRNLAVNMALQVSIFATWLSAGDVVNALRRGMRTAEVIATGGHFVAIAGAARIRRGRPLLARQVRVFSVFTPLPDLVAQLNDFRPALLFGYATAIAALAAEQEAGRLRIDPVLVVSTAEGLPPGEHETIAEVFSARVGEVYGSTEIGVAAFRCAQGWLHVNSDWVILEPVERDFSPTPPGRPSHTVLVTNLANRVQPIIRYDLGDSVTTRPDPCPCGTPLPAIRVEGRRDDTLRFPSAGGREVRVLPLALGTAIEETPGVLRFQAYQSQDGELTIRLAAEPDAEPEAVWRDVSGRVTEFLAAQGVGDVRLRRASEPPHRDPRSQKFRSIWDARARQASEGRER